MLIKQKQKWTIAEAQRQKHESDLREGQAVLERLRAGVPLAHITGYKDNEPPTDMEAIAAAKEMAETAPHKLGKDFIPLIESLLPSMTCSVGETIFQESLQCIEIVVIAAKHGPEVVPDSWIEKVREEAIPTTPWWEGKWGDKPWYYHNILRMLARHCPERINEETYSRIVETGIGNLGGLESEKNEVLCGLSYATLAEFIENCGIEWLTPEQEKRIRQDGNESSKFISREARLAGYKIDEARKKRPLPPTPEAALDLIRNSVPQKGKEIEVLKNADAALLAALPMVTDLAENEPEKLGRDIIDVLESYVPSMEGICVDRDVRDTALSFVKPIAVAAKHGPHIIPDLWIESVAEKSIPKYPKEWSGTWDGDQVYFNQALLRMLSKECPERLGPSIATRLAKTALIGSDNHLSDRRTELSYLCYGTLEALVSYCGTDRLDPRLEEKIRKDAEGNHKGYLAAKEFVETLEITRRTEIAQKRGVSKLVANFKYNL